MPTQYILRFDDISPKMAWSKFLPFKKFVEDRNIRSVLGVIPDCRDNSLNVEENRDDFFDYIRCWERGGDAIAQHGLHHVYDSIESGLLRINNRSEFSGHSFEKQFERIKAGKDILSREKVWQPWFMAPAHSFDSSTLRSLSELGFIAITDGYGFYPYRVGSLLLVPQMSSFPLNVGFGVSTICLHINLMNMDKVNKLKKFIDQKSHLFVDFKEVVSQGEINSKTSMISRYISTKLMINYRVTRNFWRSF